MFILPQMINSDRNNFTGGQIVVTNPIKKTHKKNLQWLYLLPITVFGNVITLKCVTSLRRPQRFNGNRNQSDVMLPIQLNIRLPAR